MKKFLGIVVMSLLLSGNLYADSKLDKVLEKCADTAYFTKTDIINFPFSLYSSNLEYKKIKKENEEIKIKIKKEDEEIKIKRKNANTENLIKMNKWWVENPSPKMGDFKNITTSIGSLEWPGYDEAMKKYSKLERGFSNEMRKADINFLNEITREKYILEAKKNAIEERIENLIRFSAFVYIKNSDLSLKIKIKSAGIYMDYYKNCEIEYKSTPNSFLLEWGD